MQEEGEDVHAREQGAQVLLVVKMLALMTNLLIDYFHEVPESTWNQLAAAMNNGIIVDLMARG